MTDKRERHQAIRDLIAGQDIGSQEELRLLLSRRHGLDVTQSTLSRDLREMRVARIPSAQGARYALAASGMESERTTLDALLPQLFSRIEGVGELIVLRTLVGGAQPIAVALDGEGWPDILGTIGGDDTILIICRSAAARERLTRRLETLAGRH